MIALLVASVLQLPQVPAGYVKDPGVIATGQRITPAGVQSIFNGKIGGVRFGASPGEIWVAVPGAVHHVDWTDNRTIAQARVDGRPGIFAVAIDPATHNAVVSSVGRLPAEMSAGNRRAPQVAHLTTFHDDAVGDTIAPAASSGAIGDYMIGAPAIAARAGSNGKRLAVVPLPANDALRSDIRIR